VPGLWIFYLPQLCCGFKMKSPADVGSADGLAEQGILSFLRRSNFCLNFSPFQLKQRTNYQRFNGILNKAASPDNIETSPARAPAGIANGLRRCPTFIESELSSAGFDGSDHK
jgi:hypothetical protein